MAKGPGRLNVLAGEQYSHLNMVSPSFLLLIAPRSNSGSASVPSSCFIDSRMTTASSAFFGRRGRIGGDPSQSSVCSLYSLLLRKFRPQSLGHGFDSASPVVLSIVGGWTSRWRSMWTAILSRSMKESLHSGQSTRSSRRPTRLSRYGGSGACPSQIGAWSLYFARLTKYRPQPAEHGCEISFLVSWSNVGGSTGRCRSVWTARSLGSLHCFLHASQTSVDGERPSTSTVIVFPSSMRPTPAASWPSLRTPRPACRSRRLPAAFRPRGAGGPRWDSSRSRA